MAAVTNTSDGFSHAHIGSRSVANSMDICAGPDIQNPILGNLGEVITKVNPKKFRCVVCKKCFIDTAFAEKHVMNKHPDLAIVTPITKSDHQHMEETQTSIDHDSHPLPFQDDEKADCGNNSVSKSQAASGNMKPLGRSVEIATVGTTLCPPSFAAKQQQKHSLEATKTDMEETITPSAHPPKLQDSLNRLSNRVGAPNFETDAFVEHLVNSSEPSLCELSNAPVKDAAFPKKTAVAEFMGNSVELSVASKSEVPATQLCSIGEPDTKGITAIERASTREDTLEGGAVSSELEQVLSRKAVEINQTPLDLQALHSEKTGCGDNMASSEVAVKSDSHEFQHAISPLEVTISDRCSTSSLEIDPPMSYPRHAAAQTFVVEDVEEKLTGDLIEQVSTNRCSVLRFDDGASLVETASLQFSNSSARTLDSICLTSNEDPHSEKPGIVDNMANNSDPAINILIKSQDSENTLYRPKVSASQCLGTSAKIDPSMCLVENLRSLAADQVHVANKKEMNWIDTPHADDGNKGGSVLDRLDDVDSRQAAEKNQILTNELGKLVVLSHLEKSCFVDKALATSKPAAEECHPADEKVELVDLASIPTTLPGSSKTNGAKKKTKKRKIEAAASEKTMQVSKGKSALTCGGFNVVAAFDNKETNTEGQLSFCVGDVFEVMRWSKSGWWWARSVTDIRKIGWLAPAFCQPAPPPPSCPTPTEGTQLPASTGDRTEVVDDNAIQSKQNESLKPFASSQSGKGEALPTWPPLPPLGVQKLVQPPLPPGPPPGKQSDDLAIDEFEQQLIFTRYGKLGQRGQNDLTVFDRYFNYNLWAEQKNASNSNSKTYAKRTKDGGFKHRLGS